MSQCIFCGQQVELVHVHGHYQCPVCKTNAMPCCDGDNCDTNVLLKNNEDTGLLQGESFGQPSNQVTIEFKHQIN